ncbi:MAG: cohesin domain-containing protein [Bacteroidales bacterium]|nr:cohesin domain-containing protein [Bacteroidales bacterium]MCF8405652.1 cohesin domain-containing protein [Bacteroidales bacterium]
MKKLIFPVLIIFAAIFYANGQTSTVSLDDYTLVPGQVNIPLDFTNFVDVGAITLYIEYDQSVVSYLSYIPGEIDNVVTNTYPSGSKYILGISWIDIVSVPNISGTLITLVFDYTGGTTALDFQDPLCEIANQLGDVLPVLYYDGSIAPDANAVTVTLVDQLNVVPQAYPDNYVLIPLEVDFSQVPLGVGAFNFEIEYDETILTFQELQNISTFVPGLTINVLSSPSRVALIWNATSAGINLNGKMLDLKFTYNGGNTQLDFNSSACEIADFNAEVINAIYYNGLVTQDITTMTNIIIDSVGAIAGTQVSLPVTVRSFNNVGAFDFSIGFDSQVLEFVNLTNIHGDISSGILYNAITDELNVSWNASMGGVSLLDDEVLFDITFNYLGTDQDIVFNETNCSMSDWDANPILAYYDPGKITEIGGGPITIKMDTIISPQLSDVFMPVTATGLQNIGAITLQISFDNLLLNYITVENIYPDLTSQGSSLYNSVDGTFTFAWTINGSPSQGVDIPYNGKLFDIKYFYNTGTTDLHFVTQNCEVADVEAYQMTVSYGSGQIKNGGEVEIKAFLGGAYNSSTSLMNTTLNDNNYIPLAQPYNLSPWNYTGSETVTSFPPEVVDWVLVEVRSDISETTTVERVAGLLLNDGSIVAHDNPTTGLKFYNIISGSDYYIVVWHRNHIPVMSGAPVTLPNNGTPYDFTEVVATTPYLHNSPLPAVQEVGTGGVYGMIMGDANVNGKITYTNTFNDRDKISQRLFLETGSSNLNLTVSGYFTEDTNMDGTVSYVGPLNDRDYISQIIFLITGSSYLTVYYESVVPGAIAP